jgi:hypothetical protein
MLFYILQTYVIVLCRGSDFVMGQVATSSLQYVCCFLQLDTEPSSMNLGTEEELTLQVV